MNLLYISPQFPRNYINFCTNLKIAGATVLGIASDPYDWLPDELKWALTEYYRVENMNDYAQVLEAAHYLQNRHGNIDRVESFNEYWLPLDAALREDLGVPGRKREETKRSRHKSLMKPVFQEAGIAVVQGTLVRDLNSAKTFTRNYGYPVILKPDVGVGAAATWRLNNERELIRAFEEHDLSGYFIEEFVDGEIHTFDGLTDKHGNLVFSSGLVYGQNIMEVVNADDHVYYYTSREMPPDLIDAGLRTLKAFDVKDSFFHFEFFRRRNEKALLGLEVNIRPPGAFTTDMWNYADDMDIYSAWANLAVSGTFDAKWERRYHVAYISRKDHIEYRNSHEEIVQLYGEQLMMCDRISPIFRNALGDTCYIARASDLTELWPIVSCIHQEP